VFGATNLFLKNGQQNAEGKNQFRNAPNGSVDFYIWGVSLPFRFRVVGKSLTRQLIQ